LTAPKAKAAPRKAPRRPKAWASVPQPQSGAATRQPQSKSGAPKGAATSLGALQSSALQGGGLACRSPKVAQQRGSPKAKAAPRKAPRRPWERCKTARSKAGGLGAACGPHRNKAPTRQPQSKSGAPKGAATSLGALQSSALQGGGVGGRLRPPS